MLPSYFLLPLRDVEFFLPKMELNVGCYHIALLIFLWTSGLRCAAGLVSRRMQAGLLAPARNSGEPSNGLAAKPIMGGYDTKKYGKPESLPKGSAYMQPDYPTIRYEWTYARGVHDVTRGTAIHQFPFAMDYKYEKGGNAVIFPGIKDPRLSNEPPLAPPSNGPQDDARSGV